MGLQAGLRSNYSSPGCFCTSQWRRVKVDVVSAIQCVFVSVLSAKRSQEREGAGQREQGVVLHQGKSGTHIKLGVEGICLSCFLVLLYDAFCFQSEESRPAPKISPAKTSEPAVNLLGLGEREMCKLKYLWLETQTLKMYCCLILSLLPFYLSEMCWEIVVKLLYIRNILHFQFCFMQMFVFGWSGLW